MKAKTLSEIKNKFPKNHVCAWSIADQIAKKWGYCAWRSIGDEFREALISQEVLRVVSSWNDEKDKFDKGCFSDLHQAVRFAMGIEIE